jgi:hypothetical protein
MGAELQGARGEALRRSTDILPGKNLLKSPEYQEPHRRGEILVAAVMNAFLGTWSQRIQKAKTPGQVVHMASHVAEEGADIAGALLTMWIRAIDYMPPVHLEFSDALSAALTADLEVRPDDRRLDLRGQLRRSFAGYGIKPSSGRMDQPGIWDPAPGGLRYERVRAESMRSDPDEVFRFIWENRELLNVRDGAHTEVLSVRPCVRIGEDGFVLRETVAEYYQVARLTADECKARRIGLPEEYVAVLRRERRNAAQRRRSRAGVSDELGSSMGDDDDALGALTAVYGGGVLVFDEYGKLKYHVHNDVFGRRQTARLKYLWETGSLRAGGRDPAVAAARLSSLHRQRAIGARRFPEQGW